MPLLALTQRLELLYIGLKLRKHDWFIYRDTLGIGDSVRTFQRSVHSVICPLSTNISQFFIQNTFILIYIPRIWMLRRCLCRRYTVVKWRSNIKVNMSCLGLKLWPNRKITFKPIYPWNQNVSPSIKRSRSHFTMLERAPLF